MDVGTIKNPDVLTVKVPLPVSKTIEPGAILGGSCVVGGAEVVLIAVEDIKSAILSRSRGYWVLRDQSTLAIQDCGEKRLRSE